jgi:hypothetical protein
MAAFLHPWALVIGVAAVALPVVVHFLTRPRPKVLPLSTIRFVRLAIQQRRARHRIRDALILSLRAMAVVLLAATVARPLLGVRPLVATDEPGTAARVVLLDVSQSLTAQHRGVALFERARSIAADYLADQSGLHSDLILAGATARPAFPRLSANTGALREELARAGLRPERLNLSAALSLAGDMLAQATSRRELVIVSDFQRSNWAAADFTALPADTRIQLESVAPPEPLPNLAVLRVRVPDRAEAGRDIRVDVEVGNYSSALRRVQVEVALGDGTTRLEGSCPPGARITLTGEVPLRGGGWKAGVARLLNNSDALAADDSRPFVVEARTAPTFALVTRQAADALTSSSYFLERALAPLEPRPDRPGVRVVRIDPASLDRDAVADADVVAFDHPGRLPASVPPLVADLLRRGRGVLYLTSEIADAANLQQIADAAGGDLQMPVEFVPPVPGQRRTGLFLADVRRDAPPFSIFGDRLPALTGTLRFAGGLSTRRLDGGLADDVLAAYGDRSAALVVTACGGGTLAVLNLDLAASDLPRSPAFVPLIGELTGCLLGRTRAGDAIACGEPFSVLLPATVGPAAGLSLRPPESAADAGRLIDESGGVLWQAAALTAPGVYRVERAGATVSAAAAAVPADESDLRPLDPQVLSERLAGGRPVYFRSATSDDADEHDRLWVWLAVGCLACLLSEVVVLKLFRT